MNTDTPPNTACPDCCHCLTMDGDMAHCRLPKNCNGWVRRSDTCEDRVTMEDLKTPEGEDKLFQCLR